MKAAIFREFGTPFGIEEVADPETPADGVVIAVKACGICRSDWHGWMGADADIRLPHVPGHELAGIVESVGSEVGRWRAGDRVTLPFVCGCGACPQCATGNQQVCDRQFQPGFTAWGGFAEFVAIRYADLNLVGLPDEMDFITAASLGCRFATSYRAVVDQGRVAAGEWVAVHGAGGVGLSAIMIAAAMGARVVAIDIADQKLEFARSIGAELTVNASECGDVAGAVRELTDGGAHLSLDALGAPATCFNSIAGLRKRGRHIQVGIMESDARNPPIPMGLVMSNELEIYGSHGMQAHRYPEMLKLIADGRLRPEMLIGKQVTLEDAVGELIRMNDFSTTGVTVIDRF